MLLSSTLSKTRRRIYGLLGVGLLAASGSALIGGLIVLLGHSRPDVIQPFWESGEYVALLGLFNLGIYAALFWQVGRLSRRDAARRNDPDLLTELDPDAAADSPAPPAPGDTSTRERVPDARPKLVTRRVRGSVSSLHLDP